MAAPTDPGDFTTGTTAAAAAVNTRFQRLYSALAALAIDTAQINTGAVTKAKLATDALQTFPQLLVGASLKMAFGVTTGSFNSVATRSRHVSGNIAHGLGVVPQRIFLQPGPQGGTSGGGVPAVTEDGGATSHAFTCVVVTFDATNFTYIAEINGTSNNGFSVGWMAIG